jgi:hypothetical protein
LIKRIQTAELSLLPKEVVFVAYKRPLKVRQDAYQNVLKF